MLLPLRDLRNLVRAETRRADATAGLVLGIESVPDGLASGLLAGVNPVAGLYACLFGTVGGALFTSSTFMAVQSTGAMSILIADVDLGGRDDPARALFTLSILTGLVMIAAGLFRLGSILRFVSSSVMTGFITAVGVNIVLGQLGDLTGYAASGSNRVAKTVDLLFHLGQVHGATLLVGITTIVLIVVLERSPLGSLGLVVAVIAGSALASVLDGVAVIGDIAAVPRSLPGPTLPSLADVPVLIIPAVSLAFVGLVQGAGVSAGIPNADGAFADGSQDFIGQGAGNVLSGLFQGMPVGGSMSGSSLAVTAGAKTRLALLIAGAVMAIVVLAFAPVVGHIAMPGLAGLLIVVGIGTVKPANVMSVARTGTVPLTVMATTFVLTLTIPLQYAVLCGVGISIILHVTQQSSRLVTKQLVFVDGGRVRADDPPAVVGANEVIVLQPYGSVFFAAAPALEEQMPTVTAASTNSAVLLRLRGADDAGATLIDVLQRYAASLHAVGSKLVIVTDNPRIPRQLELTGALRTIGDDNVYLGNEWVGETIRRAHDDATAWIHRDSGPTPST